MKLSELNLTQVPVIVEDDLFLYPFMITPLFLDDSQNIKALEYAVLNNTQILVISSKMGEEGSRDLNSCYDAGVIGSIMRKTTLGDGRIKILFKGLAKAKINAILSPDPILAQVAPIEVKTQSQSNVDAFMGVLKENMKKLSFLSHFFPQDILKTIDEINDPVKICDLISSALRIKKDLAYEFFIEENLENKILSLIEYIADEIESNKLQKEIRSKVHSRIEKTNKDYFLKEQLKEIQKELGDNDRDEEINDYKNKLELKKPFMGEDAYKEIKKQVQKLSKIHPDGSEASMTQSYLDWVLDIPFEKLSNANLSVKEVAKQLDEDHFGLKKPKQRIVEYFALREFLEKRKLDNKENNALILCFAGPPGIGKTSLANSIAIALKRELVRVALGGLEDVNELRGHRRTYIGAMPGRIIQGMIEAKSMNPVIVLDEIDKLASSYRGDPAAVLLEILDPEQNVKFRDYYLNFNVDLSKVIFIATANDVSTIPAPLRDRMEFIWLNSYTPKEKFEIAKRYLIKQELRKHGLKPSEVSISKEALCSVIEEYTRESGVRNLRRRIADILRKAAMNILTQNATKISVTKKNLNQFLEKKVFEIDTVNDKNYIGIVNGLAWTSVGGDVLKIEVVKIKGKGAMQITGQLGDVMKESAQIAFSLVKTMIDTKKIKISQALVKKDENSQILPIYDCYDLHIHVPEGATPKDGPSAGIALSVAIASILSDRPVKNSVAMSGEITLSGNVLPVGGLKEKLIAAHKAMIKTVIIPKKNYERDLDEIPKEVVENMQIIPAQTIDEVLKVALV